MVYAFNISIGGSIDEERQDNNALSYVGDN